MVDGTTTTFHTQPAKNRKTHHLIRDTDHMEGHECGGRHWWAAVMYLVWCNSNGQTRYERVPTSDTIVVMLQYQDFIFHISLSGFTEHLDSLQNNGSNSGFSQYIYENSHSMSPINDLDVLPALRESPYLNTLGKFQTTKETR
jgi:hypothetical protein